MEEDYYNICPQAFVLPPSLDITKVDFSKPPMTGEEFLQRVMHESKSYTPIRLPSSVIEKWRAKDNVKKFQESDTETCPEKYLISREIQDTLIADFSQTRLTVSKYKLKCTNNATWLQSQPKLPQEKNDWLIFTFGKPEVRENTSDEDYATGRPLLKILLAMSQTTVSRLLKYHLIWMEEDYVDILRSGPWIYALMTCLEIPVNGDVHYILRELARYLINLRQTIVKKTIDNINSDKINAINIIVILIARYFKQFDLIESYRMK